MAVTGLLEENIALPAGVTASYAGRMLTVKGPKGTLAREFFDPRISLTVAEGIRLRMELPRRAEKARFGTWVAHIRNMVRGAGKGFEYTMKIVYSHFPIKTTVKASGKRKEVIIENFLGERFPRKAAIVGDCEVKISGDQVMITGPDKEAVGQTSANIELATRIKNYDPRVFQDGIYIVSKGVK